MAQNVVYADLKFAEGSLSTIPGEDDSPYENVLPGPVTAAPSPGGNPDTDTAAGMPWCRRRHIPRVLLPASLILLLLLLVAIVALGACYWQVTRSLQDTSRDYAAERGRLSEELSTQEQSLEQTERQLERARAELQQAWHEGNISQQELKNLSTELGHVKEVLGKTEQEMQEMQGKLNNSESTASSLRACVNTDCCPSGWVLYRSKCLFISVQKTNWWNSKSYCKQKSAQLLVE
ncbi:CD72 protein, partial [Onychorhynchus coronatus]|nr:CD72 protein [Onychorhynchus coronatus]